MLRWTSATAAALATSGALVAPAAVAAPVVRSAPLHAGRNALRFTVPHRTGARPPLIHYDVAPAGSSCSLRDAGYHAVQKAPRRPRIGTLELKVRCRSVARGARAQVRLTAPIVRSKALHDGTGRIRLRLPKPPGRVEPAILLQTRPRTTGCRLTHLRTRSGSHRFRLDGRFRCRGLHRPTTGILVVGGIIAAGRPPTPSARAARLPPCTPIKDETVTRTVFKRSQSYCMDPLTTVEIHPYSLPCPAGSKPSTSDPWPGFTYSVKPDTGWWDAGVLFDDWAITNWSLDVGRVLTVEWYCTNGAPVSSSPPTISGDAAVGRVLTCQRGAWEGGLTSFDYQWQRVGADGALTPIAGATGQTYVATSTDARRQVVCTTTAGNGFATAQATSAPSSPIVDAPPRNLQAPSISVPEFQSPSANRKLTCNGGSWDQLGPGLPFGYEWQRDGAVVAGQTGAVLQLPTGWVGSVVTCRVTARNALGATSATSAGVTVVESGGILL